MKTTMKKLANRTTIGVESVLSLTLLHVALASAKFSRITAKAGAKLGEDMAKRIFAEGAISDGDRAVLEEGLKKLYEQLV